MNIVGRIVRLLLASALGFGVLTGASQVVAAAEPSGNFDFTSCIQSQKSASILILLDESGSVYKSDPSGYRKAAVKSLLARLDDVVTRYNGTEIAVQVAGAGADYNPISTNGDWVTINSGNTWASQPASVHEKVDALSPKSKQDKGVNSAETDLYASFAGASGDFAAVHDKQPETAKCSLFVFFKDGADWQHFNRNGNAASNVPEVQALLDQRKFSEADQLASEKLCEATGIADQIRDQGIYTLAVALGDGTYSQLKGISSGEGSVCGATDPYGAFISTTDVVKLPEKLAQALDPSGQLSAQVGPFTIHMTNALSSMSILSTSKNDFSKFTITAPDSCVGGENVQEFNPSALDGNKTLAFGQGVTSEVEKFDNRVIRVTIRHTGGADSSCWVGDWKVNPWDKATQSILEFDADLQAIAKFEDEDFYLVPGGQPKSFDVQMERISSQGSKVDVSNLDKSLAFTVTGSVIDDKGNVVEVLFGGASALTRDSIDMPQSLAPGDLAKGDYKLMIELQAEVKGLGVDLRPVRTEVPFTIRDETPAPTFPKAINFGSIVGNSASSVTVAIDGSAMKDFTVDFSKSTVILDDGPDGVTYDIVGLDDATSITVPRGTDGTQVTLQIKPQGSEPVYKDGRVSGTVSFAATQDGVTSPTSIDVKFYAIQKPDVNTTFQVLLTALLTGLGVAAILGALQLVAWMISKFPRQDELDNSEASYAVLYGELSDAGFATNSNTLGSGLAASLNGLTVDSTRRLLQVDGYDFAAKSPGWTMGTSGYGVPIDSSAVGWGSASHHDSPKRLGPPRIGLDLQKGWALLVNRESLAGDVNGQIAKTIPATAILFVRNDPDTGMIDPEYIEQVYNELASKAEVVYPALASGALVASASQSKPTRNKKARGNDDEFGQPTASSSSSRSEPDIFDPFA